MAADGGPLTGGPGLSRCPLLAARSSAGLSKPDHPLKAEGETEGKSDQAVQMIKFKHCAPSAILALSLSHISKDQGEFFTKLCFILISSFHEPVQA